jgi:hypothetical protein
VNTCRWTSISDPAGVAAINGPDARTVTVIFERPRQGAFGFRPKLRFAPADKDQSAIRINATTPMAMTIGPATRSTWRPSKRPDSVAEEKLPPWYAIGSSQDAGNAA